MKPAPNHIQSLVLRYLNPISDDHWKALYRKKRQLVTKDEFGIEDESGIERFNKELLRYVDKLILPNARSEDLTTCYTYVCTISGGYAIGLDGAFMECLKFFMNATIDHNASELANEIDAGRPEEGIAYEYFCCSKFNGCGWSAKVTQASSDQGCDLIATIMDITLVVQCKLYSNPVGNKAVQEIVGAMRHYGATHGAVVTNSTFTRSAQALARSNKIYLIHDSDISNILKQIESGKM
jgi:hypothetical protein